ncbi:MAG: calcium-binding protein [Yoonia sp.]|uniref:calcium-binding protein n=1 Tax=Yoonia sp. TaxID=2212373 RepID=UPI003EF502BB
MIDSQLTLRQVLKSDIGSALRSDRTISAIWKDHVSTAPPSVTIDFEGNDVWIEDILPLYGSLDDHIAQGFGVVAISGRVEEDGYFFDSDDNSEGAFTERVGFYGTYLINYDEGTIVDTDLVYDTARDVFDDSSLTELGDGTVHYEIEYRSEEATFGFEEPDADDLTLTPLEDLNFGPPAEPIVFDGTSDDDVFEGGEGDDTLLGQSGNDTLYGLDGDDTIDGGHDGDRLYGGDGDDLLKGGGGADDLVGGDGADVLKGNSGNDFISGGLGQDRLSGGSGDDTLRGGNDEDRLDGHSGNDALYGGHAADVLRGGGDNDSLFGGHGDDDIKGDGGDDTLMGGAGDDVLTGGEGLDVFVIGTQDDANIITDFTVSEDKLALVGFSGDLSDLFLSQEDSALRLQWGESEVLLENTDQDDISEADFVI